MSTLAQAGKTVDVPNGLTPHRVLAAALAYIVSSGPGLQDAQRVQLLTVLGGDEAAIQEALACIRQIPFEQFLQDAPRFLSPPEKLCVLVNVCDVLLADKKSEPAALVLFQRMLAAFGFSAEAFAPYYKTLVLKNDSTVLGAYQSKTAAGESLTAHVALATSILYAMAASGSIAEANMGQLQALIGSYEGLQSIALAYIRRVKFNQFLPQAGVLLTEPQKIYILIQACSAVLLNSRVEDFDRQMFNAMLLAFGYSDRSFHPYFQTIEIQHLKLIDETEGKSAAPRGAKKPRVFEKREIHSGDKTKAPEGSVSTNTQQIGLPNAWAVGEAGPRVSRIMRDNLQEVHGESGLGANIQKIGRDDSALNRQTLDEQGLAPNRQTISTDGFANNRQTLASAPQGLNHQRLGPSEEVGDNRQSVGMDRYEDQFALIRVEARLKDLDLIIDNLKRKIDQFERKNKTVLREASQAKLSHPPHASDEIAQMIVLPNPQLVPAAYLPFAKAAERILDLKDEANHWNVIWISSTVAIVSLTCAMSLSIVLV